MSRSVGKRISSSASATVEPAHILELVVVVGEVAPRRLHQVVVHGLVDAAAVAHEAVVDVADGVEDAHLQAGLLGTSRTAVSSGVSSPSGVPLGSDQMALATIVAAPSPRTSSGP